MKRFKMVGGQPYPILFKAKGYETAGDSKEPTQRKYIDMPEVVTPDIVAIEARFVQSGPNLNKAYFDQVELVKAYHTVSYKALDIEHELENIVGHIYASKYVDQKSGEELTLDFLKTASEEDLRKMGIDVVVGGVVYIDRFPALESPLSRKAPAISMEVYYSAFDLLLSNGIRVTAEEAETLGWHTLLEQLMANYETREMLEAAHQVKVIMADKSEVPLEVYKWLKELSFSGGGLVSNPACPTCTLISTSLESNCGDCKDHEKSTETSKKEQAGEIMTLNLTQLESYMKQWRESPDGKKLNHQVKDNIITLSIDDEKRLESSTDDGPVGTHPSPKDRDPNKDTKTRSICVNYKYELWVMQGDQETEMRHWCTYANEKCPTAGDKTFHECNRWYNREGDWIMDMRNFRDADNPFAPEGYDPNDPDKPSDKDILATSSVSYKQMRAMVDSFYYQVESIQRDRELESKGIKKNKSVKPKTQHHKTLDGGEE